MHHFHPSKHDKYIITRAVSVIAFIYPLTALPQVYSVWWLKQVAGVSLLTWSLFLILSIPMLLYAMVREDRVLIIMYGFWIIIHLSVVSGIILYS